MNNSSPDELKMPKTSTGHRPVMESLQESELQHIKARLKQPVIFDGRNLFEPASVTALGIEYHGIGRQG